MKSFFSLIGLAFTIFLVMSALGLTKSVVFISQGDVVNCVRTPS